jgi:lipoprotein LpqH
VGIGKVDGVSYAYSAFAGTEPAVAHKDGNTYTITGTARGVDLTSPVTIMSNAFELVVVCP